MSSLRPSVAISNRKRAKPAITRFHSLTNKAGPIHPEHGYCWEWTGHRFGSGYASLTVDGEQVSAARFSYVVHIGVIPKGLCVLHRCDNPGCVNPSHLFTGTHLDNCLDKENKRRGNHPRGEENGRAILTESQVKEIRRLYKKGHRKYGAEGLAKRFRVSSYPIMSIVKGRNWKHVIN